MSTRKKPVKDSGSTEISIAKIGLISAIVVAAIGMLGTVISAYFSSRAAQAPIVIPLQATQTQEARLAAQLPAATSPLAASPVLTVQPAAQSLPTALLALQPLPTDQPASPTPPVDAASQAGAPPATAIPADIALSELEQLLGAANLGLSSTGTEEGLAAMRSYFTGPEAAYQMLAIASLEVVGQQRLKKTVYLDMIDEFYTTLVGGEDQYLDQDGRLRADSLRQAILQAYNNYYGEYKLSLEPILESRQ
jgi:hypothetical protein